MPVTVLFYRNNCNLIKIILKFIQVVLKTADIVVPFSGELLKQFEHFFKIVLVVVKI